MDLNEKKNCILKYLRHIPTAYQENFQKKIFLYFTIHPNVNRKIVKLTTRFCRGKIDKIVEEGGVNKVLKKMKHPILNIFLITLNNNH